jgi:hypothetical protein
MITKFGKRFITSYLANGDIFKEKDIAIGIGSDPASLNDTDLQFEFYRSGVFLGSSDIQTDQITGNTTYSIVYKTTLPTDVEGVISEIGLYPAVSAQDTDYSSQYISAFDEAVLWYDSNGDQPIIVTTPQAKVSSGSFSLSAESGESNSYKLNTEFDISGYGSEDYLNIAFNQIDLNLDYVFVKFYSSPSAYKEVRFDASNTIGNKVVKVPFSDLLNSEYTSVEQINFSAITIIEVGIKALSAETEVLLDAFRINDNDNYNTQYGLISRSVLSTPIVKKFGVEMDIEYKINLGFL